MTKTGLRAGDVRTTERADDIGLSMKPLRTFVVCSALSAGSVALAQEAVPPIIEAPPATAPQPAAPPIGGRVFTPGETIAIVGDQHILVGDMLGDINQMLAPYADKASPEELEEQRQKMIRQFLPNMIDNKILYLEFLRQVPKDKVGEVQKRVTTEFDEQKLEAAVQRAKVNSPAELDAMLRQYGSSLEKQRRTYMEQQLGRAMLGKVINYKPEITHEEMLAYYKEHAKDFDIPAKASWEQLSVKFENHPSKEAAWQKLSGMGNEVLRGAQFAAVAKKHSEEPCASDGGYHEPVTRGALASDVLDKAIFSLPTKRLSPILEDATGFHIVRVLERSDDSRVDFVKAQEEIKEKIRQQKVKEQIQAQIAKLKKKTKVWTAFDIEPTSDE
jgi:parvulin-like peptidyl-prolyl isomerase